MNWRSGLAVASALAVFVSGCSRDLDPLGLAPFPPDPDVFLDGFGSGVGFQAFGGSKTDALDVDATERFRGAASLRITVPAPGDPSGGFAGGAFVTSVPRDLTGYDALTFWAKASTAATMDVIGLGNDNSGTSRFSAERSGIQLSTSWTKYILPIPLAAKLSQEKGLFFFADGADGGLGYTIWFDDIQFERTGKVTSPRPQIPTQNISGEIGAKVSIQGTTVTFDVDGSDQTLSASPGYFTFTSSSDAVAIVGDDAAVEVVGPGSATITATLGTVPAEGTLTVVATTPPTGPAPAPTADPSSVISLFSNAYTNVTVDTWSAEWDNADLEDIQIGGDDVKKYSNLTFAGVEFTSQPIDASAMTHFHVDAWIQDASAFRLKLVDFGPDGVFGGGDDSEHEVALSDATTPSLSLGAWSSLDIPLSDFPGLATRGSLAQLVISGSSKTVYLDNVYFYGGATSGPTEPDMAAPTPSVDASKVTSLFSNAYPNATVDTWSAEWDQADVEDVQIAGDDVKKYTNLVFAGIEFTSATVDASTSTHFHLDMWTPDATAGASLRIKLVDFGADGAFEGGDDVEHEITLTDSSMPALATGEWVSIDIPFSDFTGLTTRGHLAQMIIAGDPNTVFVDNVYVYDAAEAPTEPQSAAPVPTTDPADAISLFSNAYSNATVDTWSAEWDQADLEDVQIAGDDVKKYTNLVFAGIEFTSATVDASAMTHFHLDMWTPDATAGASFRIKLVDFGADGAFQGGDDVEHEITLTDASIPALATGEWVGIDLPFTDFPGLTTRGHLAQIVVSGDPNTVFIDNVYLRR